MLIVLLLLLLLRLLLRLIFLHLLVFLGLLIWFRVQFLLFLWDRISISWSGLFERRILQISDHAFEILRQFLCLIVNWRVILHIFRCSDPDIPHIEYELFRILIFSIGKLPLNDVKVNVIICHLLVKWMCGLWRAVEYLCTLDLSQVL